MAGTSCDMHSLLDVQLDCISFLCIATVFGGIAVHCRPIVEKACISSRAGVAHPERHGMVLFLVLNLVLGAAGATLFYRGLYSIGDPWSGEDLVGGLQIIQELCLIVLWVVSATACASWTAYTLLAIWDLTKPCSVIASGGGPNGAKDETDIDLEAQIGCTHRASTDSTGEEVRVRDDAERTVSGEDTLGSGDGCSAAPSDSRETTPPVQAEQKSYVIWSANEEISLSQSSDTTVYTPASSHSGSRNHTDGHGESADARTSAEAVSFADVMVRHLRSCPWVQSAGDTWHDMEACERRSGLGESQSGVPKDFPGAQQPIERAQTMQTTQESRIETTLNNSLENTSENTPKTASKITTNFPRDIGAGVASRPSIPPHEVTDNNRNLPHEPSSSFPIPSPASRLSTQATHSSPSTAAWEKLVPQLVQSRYARRLRFALEEQDRHMGHWDLETGLRRVRDTDCADRVERVGGGKEGGTVGVVEGGADEVGSGLEGAGFEEGEEEEEEFLTGEAGRLERQWRRRRGELDGVLGGVSGGGVGWGLGGGIGEVLSG